MKIHKSLYLGVLLLTGVISGCGDDESTDNTVVITVDDAAEYVAASMAVATYGAVYNMDYVADQIVELINCNESESDNRTGTEISSNGEITVNYTISENYSRICEGELETINYNFSTDQTTTSERINSNTGILGGWTIGGAESSSAEYIYNGNYSRGGEWTYNLEDNHTDYVTSSFVFTNLKANKEDNIIFDGTSTFSLNGSSTVY
jgi:hypothetical protein